MEEKNITTDTMTEENAAAGTPVQTAPADTAAQPKKPSCRKKKEEPEEVIPELEEAATDENGEQSASVLLRNGNLILSRVSRIKDTSCIPVVCDYGKTDSFARGIEIYTAKNLDQAKDLIGLLASAEQEDRMALGQTTDIFYSPDRTYAEVINSQKKTDMSVFSLGTAIAGFSLEMPATQAPDSMKTLMAKPASAVAPGTGTTDAQQTDTAQEKPAGNASDGLANPENETLICWLLVNKDRCAQFLNKKEDELAAASYDEKTLRGMLMAQILFTEDSILKQWYALSAKTA